MQCVFEHVYIVQSEMSDCKSIGRSQKNPDGHFPRAEVNFKVSVSSKAVFFGTEEKYLLIQV